MTRAGSCLCGAVQFELDDPNDTGISCHCTSCRRSSSSHSFNIRTKKENVKLTKGTPKTYEDNGTDSGKTARRSFCGDCGSPVWTDPDSMPGIRVVKVGALEDAKDVKLGLEIYVDSAIPSQLIPKSVDGHKQFEGPMRKEV